MANDTDLEIFIGANTAQFREAMQKARDDIQTVNEEVRAAAAATEDGADKFTTAQVRATQRLLQSIDPTLRSMDALEVKQRRIEKALREGKISTEEYSRAMQVLTRDLDHTQAKERLYASAFGQSTAAMQRQEQMLKKMNISVGQYRSAIGMLPAQMTDVVTQLAGGQNPLLILLQQGGQIKDSFGGIRNMFMALGSAISPAALGIMGVTGGILGLSYAYYKVDKEQQDFNRSLIMTGQYAGKTRDELLALSHAMAGNGVSQWEMSSIVAKTVGTGAFTGSAIEMVANTAAKLEQVTGVSIESTIEQFKRLQKDPVAAVKELDSQLHFLTSTQLEQINSLALQGRVQDAAKIAMNAYADTVNSRTNEMKESLGTLSQAWLGVKKAMGAVSDAVSDAFRDSSRQGGIAALEVELKRLKSMPQDIMGNREAVARVSSLLSVLKHAQDLHRDISAVSKDADQANEARKKQVEATEKLNREYESEEERHLRILANIRNSGASKEAILKATNAENERYAKSQSRGNGGTLQGESLADRYSQRLAQTREALQLEISGANQLTQSERDLIALRQRLDDLKGRSLTKTEQSVVANAAVLEKLLSQNVAEEKALEHQKALNELKLKGEQLSMQLGQDAARDQRMREIELNGMGMGDLARERMRQEAALRDHYAQLQGELERVAKQKGTLGSDEYNADLQMLQESLNQRLQKQREYYASVDALRADWHVGVSSSMQNIKDLGNDVAGAAGAALTGAFNSAADSLANFVTTGKSNFRSFTSSILADLARIAARMALSKAVGGLFSLLGGAIGGENSGVRGGNAFTNGMYDNLPMFAKGGVFSNSPNLSAYSGSVVSRPTLFAFAKGAGLMGEAGEEAIMPLARNSKGELAVKAVGAGNRSAAFSPTYNITIQNDGKNGEIGPGALKAVYEIGQKGAADYLRQQGRDGGHLSGVYR
ncbi:phage tail tape measure protein [Edwardsiella piscicida]|nr:phage tail tape measure protein [Edwardsiella piscicida]ELV7535529.1 phage tail tape measure protein [Edwardsiella piscicida]